MELKFCQQCGTTLELREIGDEGLLPFCIPCDQPYFKNPVTCILVAVVNEENEMVLLRQDYISRTHWVLVAGYMKQKETAEEAVVREVKEETGLDVLSCQYVTSYVYKEPNILLLGFIAHVKKNELLKVSNEVDDLKWIKIEKSLPLLREDSNGQHHVENVIAILNK